MEKKNVSLKSAVKQSGNISGFIAGLYESNYELMSRSMVDLFAEPFRRGLIPGYDSIHQAAMENGAIGCGISGSGPSIFALSDSKERAEIIGKKMVGEFQKAGLTSKLFISSIHTHSYTSLSGMHRQMGMHRQTRYIYVRQTRV